MYLDKLKRISISMKNTEAYFDKSLENYVVNNATSELSKISS